MIRIDVTLFAHARDLAGTGRETVELPAGATASDLLRLLEERHPRLSALGGRARLAVNRAYAAPTLTLSDGDEAAVIPPVSGG